jgi:hypothetical protein
LSEAFATGFNEFFMRDECIGQVIEGVVDQALPGQMLRLDVVDVGNLKATSRRFPTRSRELHPSWWRSALGLPS